MSKPLVDGNTFYRSRRNVSGPGKVNEARLRGYVHMDSKLDCVENDVDDMTRSSKFHSHHGIRQELRDLFSNISEPKFPRVTLRKLEGRYTEMNPGSGRGREGEGSKVAGDLITGRQIFRAQEVSATRSERVLHYLGVSCRVFRAATRNYGCALACETFLVPSKNHHSRSRTTRAVESFEISWNNE